MKNAGKEAVVQPIKEDLKSLTEAEKTNLLECESKIEQSQKNFITVGEALTRINETQLYKGTHSSFDKYCEERWDFSGSHARRQMDAYAVIVKLRSGKKPIGETDLPGNEFQARLLRESKAKQHWIRCWQTIVKTAKDGEKHITASLIEEALGTKGSNTALPKAKATKKESTVAVGVEKALQKIGEARKRLAKNEKDFDFVALLDEIESFLKA